MRGRCLYEKVMLHEQADLRTFQLPVQALRFFFVSWALLSRFHTFALGLGSDNSQRLCERSDLRSWAILAVGTLG